MIARSPIRWAVGGLASTWRFEIAGREHLDACRGSARPFIYALWHCEILPLIWFHRRTPASLVVSAHQDGQILADAAVVWGFDLIRGSSTRGGAEAMRGILRALARGSDVAITPDGPRGPARQVKSGVIKAAGQARVPILPVRALIARSWQLRSWDGFHIPKPFTTIQITYGKPVSVDDASNCEEAAGVLQRSLGGGLPAC